MFLKYVANKRNFNKTLTTERQSLLIDEGEL